MHDIPCSEIACTTECVTPCTKTEEGIALTSITHVYGPLSSTILAEDKTNIDWNAYVDGCVVLEMMVRLSGINRLPDFSQVISPATGESTDTSTSAVHTKVSSLPA